MDSPTLQDRNKSVVVCFNKRVIEAGDDAAFRELMAPGFTNHSAPPGMSSGADGMWHTFSQVLRPAFPDLVVDIEDQLTEGDRVVTRKTIRGTHLGPLMGIPATGKPVAMSVIDIVRLEDGRYAEHWGVNTLAAVRAQLLG
ncbi:ester cyclase [Devosia sp.]|uniref:ester cyclase n=1 Tax=Devosia sp. TaxID=1871048 RepID=UPI001AC116DF|nr:ester cyclase [Devosia sp.]MBN9309077.1 ester cyclase [Devosia sp.]